MTNKKEFDFGDDSVATGYDNLLVPFLFTPWTLRLINEFEPWEGLSILDLATGTGIVAQHLAEQVGPSGNVTGADINPEMLELAKKRCAGITPEVNFVECPDNSLDIASDSVDRVVCQQGFQFFPDKKVAAKEIYRVLKNGGEIISTTWRPVEECQFFGALCNALESIGEHEISQMMRMPFDFLSESELIDSFESSGFKDVQVIKQEQDFLIDRGIKGAIDVAYATPIRPKLLALSEGKQEQFRDKFSKLLKELSPDGVNMGKMFLNLLLAEKTT